MCKQNNRFLDGNIGVSTSDVANNTPDTARNEIAERHINSVASTVYELNHSLSGKNCQNFSNDELAKIAAKLLTSIWDIRRAINYRCDVSQEAIHNNAKCIPENICSVSSVENAVLRVTLPFLLDDTVVKKWLRTLPNPTAHSIENDLMFVVKAKVMDFLQCNPQIVIPDGFIYLIYKRFVPRKGAILRISDSNNIETGAITNGISQAIGVSDNAYSMGFIYAAEESELLRTEVTLISSNALPYWIKYLQNDIRKN